MGLTELEARIGDYVDRRADEMIGFLRTVVSTRSLWGDVGQLAMMGKILGERMAGAGVEVTYPDSGTPGAPNVSSRWDGSSCHDASTKLLEHRASKSAG